MKNFKIFLLCFPCFIFLLASCDSVEQPLPDEYVGTYRNGAYGDIVLTNSYVSTTGFLVSTCYFSGVEVNAPSVRFANSSFTYFSDGTF